MSDMLTDQIICYSPQEAKAVRVMIPHVESVLVCTHPSNGSCRCSSNFSQKAKRLLVVFGGNLHKEMSLNLLAVWLKVISQSIQVAGIEAVDVRIHPRTDNHLQWPVKICSQLQKLVKEVNLIRAQEKSLCDIICDYSVILGGPSGALRVARAVCPYVIVLGMGNCADQSPDDQDWILGDIKGVHWIKNGVVLEEYFQLMPAEESYPSVAQNLRS